MALSAKFSISASYAIIRSYSSELFPEFKRKTYISTCSYMARLGSIIAPFIIGFVCDNKYWKKGKFISLI
jgi:MFS family permease